MPKLSANNFDDNEETDVLLLEYNPGQSKLSLSSWIRPRVLPDLDFNQWSLFNILVINVFP